MKEGLKNFNTEITDLLGKNCSRIMGVLCFIHSSVSIM